MVDPKIDSGIAYPVKFPKTAWNSPGYILTYRKKLSYTVQTFALVLSLETSLHVASLVILLT